MAELADAQDLGSCGRLRAGSSPVTRTRVVDTTYINRPQGNTLQPIFV